MTPAATGSINRSPRGENAPRAGTRPGEGGERRLSLTVGPAESGLRLDAALARLCPEESRSSIQRLIRCGHATVGGNPVKAGDRAREGMKVVLVIPPPQTPDYGPEAIPLDIIHEDDEIVVVNKPAGLVTHPAPGSHTGTLVNALLHRYPELLNGSAGTRHGIVHRLDKGTSGVMVVARTPRSHRLLSAAFKARRVEKTYLALVWDNVAENETTVSLPIGRDRKDRKKMSPRTNRPREATTEFRVLRRLGRLTLVEARPRTGRTHQIRVHLAHLKHPIVGDPAYGRRSLPTGLPEPWRSLLRRVERPLLHAWKLAFVHPGLGTRVEFVAPPPADLAPFLSEAGRA